MPDSSTRSRADAAATRRWAERLERFSASNHTAVAFCAAEGVSASNFYLWKRRLAQPHATAPNQPKVVPIRVAPPPAPATPIELALPSGTVLRLPADARPELIVAILRGLEERPC
jgi:transposase